MAARFGEMLLNRRRQLGLSIQQVANTVKIRPQIIEFFETENFASMPPRGYAQGMISSYARFLGLNPREVVNAYFDELVEYEHASGNPAGHFQEGAGYVSQRSSVQNGRFLMVDGGRSDASRYGQRPPQAGYVTESGSGREIRAMRDRVRRTLPPAESSVPASYGNSVRDPRAGYGDGGYTRRSPQNRNAIRPYDASSRQRRGNSVNRPVPQGQNARRRQQVRPQTTQGNRQRQRSTRWSNGGFLSTLDPRFVAGGIVLIIAVVVLIAFLLFRGCSSSSAATSAPAAEVAQTSSAKKTSSKKKSSKSEDASTDSSDDSADDTAASDATDADAADTDSSSDQTEQVIVKVKIPKKKTAWLEIKVDGKSVYAAQTTGPYSQKFTPESSIEITTSKPSFVSIYKNGKKVRYDTKTAGVARVTVTVPKKTADTQDASADGSDSSQTDSASDSTSSLTSSSTTGSGTSTQSAQAATTTAQTSSTASSTQASATTQQ